MRGIVFLGIFLAFSLAQTLSVAPEGRVGQALAIRGSEFTSGKYTLQIQGPTGKQTLELEAVGGSFSADFTPTSEGLYRFEVGQIQTQSQILPEPQAPQTSSPQTPTPSEKPTAPAKPSLPPVVQPQLQSDGLVIGGWRLPLQGKWIGPRTAKGRTYIAQGPLVLEVDLANPAVVAQHYPPAEVRSLETDPELAVVLQDGRRLSLGDLAGRPYEGAWASLQVIRDYRQNLEANRALEMDKSPSAGRPYWYYFVQDPSKLSASDLEAVGHDLIKRGHRPELAWGSGVMVWLQPWLAQLQAVRSRGLDSGLAWSEFFLKYMPLLPGATAIFSEQIGWLEAQGRPDLAQRYRQGLRQLATWQNPLSAGGISRIAAGLLGLYALMLLYLNLVYFPAQLRGVRPAGGWFSGWFVHPLVRLRHTLLAYTTVGERILLTSLFILLTLALLAWGFALRSENLIAQDSLTRGTLRSNAAQETLRTLANTGPMRGLLGYALAKDNPSEAQRLLAAAPDWTYVLLNRGTPEAITQAARQAPASAAVKDVLGSGGDLWTAVYRDAGVAREGVPTPRIISSTVTLSGLQALQSDFLGVWRSLPIWINDVWAWVIALLILLLTLYHILCFFIPRPNGAAADVAWRRGVQLFFPGSPSYSQGWGILLLAAVIGGIWYWRLGIGAGLLMAGLALLIHLILWGMWFARARTA